MNGIQIYSNDKEVVLKGTKDDLLELSEYINKVASEENNTHLHLDDMTLISKNSVIDNLIIEKEER